MKRQNPADESWRPISLRKSEEPSRSAAQRRARERTDDPRYVRSDEQHRMTPLRWYKPRRATISASCDLFRDGMDEHALNEVLAITALTWLLNADHRFLMATAQPDRMAEYLLSNNTRRINEIATLASELLENNIGQCLQQFAPHHKWPLPRKKLQPGEIDSWLLGGKNRVPKNLWTGTVVNDQESANKRVPALQRIPSPVRFIKAEPLKGEMTLKSWLGAGTGIQWVITGGESTGRETPCKLEWLQSIVDECRHAGVAAFVTQIGRGAVKARRDANIGRSTEKSADRTGADPVEWPSKLRCREWPEPLQQFWAPR